MLRHSIRVAALGWKIAKKMKIGNQDMFFVAGIMHDLGKTRWPEELHDKKGPSKEEWAIIHEHPINSGKIAKEIWPNIPSEIYQMIVNHHERPDGKGTPRGISNTFVPSLILAAADVYDAMTRKRAYRSSVVFSPEQSIEEIARWAPHEVVNALAELVGVSLAWSNATGDKAIKNNLVTIVAKGVQNGKHLEIIDKDTLPINSKTPVAQFTNPCPFLQAKYGNIADKEAYTCNNEFRVDQATLFRSCFGKWQACTDYIRLIALDLQEKFRTINLTV